MSEKAPKVWLIYPPSRTQRHDACPVGLLMLGAVLENRGCEVRLIDANANRRPLTSEMLAAEVQKGKPDVVGVTLLTPLVKEAYRLAGLLRKTGTRLLAGGPHATLLPEEPLRHGFDGVVLGEGEPTVYEAVLAVLGKDSPGSVRGYAYLDQSGNFSRTEDAPIVEDLDTLPFPARHLVDPLDYVPDGNPKIYRNIFSSRGCPARCSYCAGQLFGKRFRFRSAENVLAEIASVHETYGTNHFFFVDDAMSMDRKRVADICRGLKGFGPKITWNMMTRIDAVDEELLKLAAQSGCTTIDYGVESGSPETLKRIRKPHTVEMVRKVIPLTRSYGIKPYVFFIVGFPWETDTHLRETRQLMEELAPYVDTFHPAIASILIPFPGTAIYDEYQERFGFANWWLGSERNYDAPSMSTHTYWQKQLFRNGAVLDADFFHYGNRIRNEIFGFFQFMFRHNLNNDTSLKRVLHQLVFSLSYRLGNISPALERFFVRQPISLLTMMRQSLRGRAG